MKKLSVRGETLLKNIEALRLHPYDDQTGKTITVWTKGATIGYGHLIAQHTWDDYKEGISQEQADVLFRTTIVPFEHVVNTSILVLISQHQFDAAILLAYNIGVIAFKNSSVVKLINNPETNTPYATLEDAWKSWNKSQGIVNRGLINRRHAEWNIYSKGIYKGW